MKIAFLNKYQNKVARGAETYIAELSKRLSRNHEVDVISDISYWNLLGKKYDVIIPTNGGFQAIAIRKICWLKGSKMIVSGQSGPGFDDRINLYSFPDAFIGLTNYQSDWAKKINPFIKVITIPNGVDLSIFKAGKENTVIKTALSVGAFTKEKRHDLTIKAVSRLKDIKLKIVGGGGDLKNEIKLLGEKMLGDRFEILSVPYGEMPQIYKKADVLAFPTVPWESFGIAMVEAMATNLPVVATNDPIRKEIVGDAGILVDPTDTEAYSHALREALDKDWGDKPRKQAEKFDWDIIAQKYEELFKSLVKKK